jgi:hypothetical protein
VAAGGAAPFVIALDGSIAAAAPTETAGLRGNVARVAQSTRAVLFAGVSGPAVVTDNRLTLLQNAKNFAANIQAQSAIAANNRIDAGPGAQGDLTITVPALPGSVATPVATVLGNIVRSGIAVNGGGLPAPMQPLNITTG